MITDEVLNRILEEREARHKAELEKLKAEMKLESMENRLLQIEKKLEEEDQEDNEPAIAGFKMTDLMQAYTMYQQMQQSKA